MSFHEEDLHHVVEFRPLALDVPFRGNFQHKPVAPMPASSGVSAPKKRVIFVMSSLLVRSR